MQVKNKLYDNYKNYHFWLECDAKSRDWVYAPENNGDKMFQLAEVISEDRVKQRNPQLTITKSILRKATNAEIITLLGLEIDKVAKDLEKEMKSIHYVDKQEKEKEEMNESKTGKEIVEKWQQKNKSKLNEVVCAMRNEIQNADETISEINKLLADVNDYIECKNLEDSLKLTVENTSAYITDNTRDKLSALGKKHRSLKKKIEEKANETIILLGMCETYGQKIALLQTKKIVTVETDISVFVTEEYVKNYQMED